MANESILVVDDNPTNLKLLKVLMSLEGYKVTTAMDANEALELLHDFQPDLILMDVQLPGMDGLELTRTLRANPAYKNIIILAVTAFAMKGDDEKTIAAGCNGYISKPIDTQQLPLIVEEYLKNKKA